MLSIWYGIDECTAAGITDDTHLWTASTRKEHFCGGAEQKCTQVSYSGPATKNWYSIIVLTMNTFLLTCWGQVQAADIWYRLLFLDLFSWGTWHYQCGHRLEGKLLSLSQIEWQITSSLLFFLCTPSCTIMSFCFCSTICTSFRRHARVQMALDVERSLRQF